MSTQVTAQSIEAQASGLIDMAAGSGLLKPLLGAVLKKLIESGAAQKLIDELLKKAADWLTGTTPPTTPTP
jgi:hypothetical protein